jgi:hypothetical protein
MPVSSKFADVLVRLHNRRARFIQPRTTRFSSFKLATQLSTISALSHHPISQFFSGIQHLCLFETWLVTVSLATDMIRKVMTWPRKPVPSCPCNRQLWEAASITSTLRSRPKASASHTLRLSYPRFRRFHDNDIALCTLRAAQTCFRRTRHRSRQVMRALPLARRVRLEEVGALGVLLRMGIMMRRVLDLTICQCKSSVYQGQTVMCFSVLH